MDQIPRLPLLGFEYTTVQDLREQGLEAVDLATPRALGLIREKSVFVNDLTEQWFAPVRGTAVIDGRGSRLVFLPNAIPILHVEEIRIIDPTIDEEDGAEPSVLLEPEEYVVKPRWIELEGKAKPRPGIIHVKGAFGWLEDVKTTRFTAVTTTLLNASGTSVVLDTVTGLAVKDVLLLGDGDSAERAIVLSIDRNTKTVTFQAVTNSLAVGSSVYAYGRVPRQIEKAVQQLVYFDKCPPFERGKTVTEPSLTPGLGFVPTTGVKTGHLGVDLILSDFMAPPVPRMV